MPSNIEEVWPPPISERNLLSGIGAGEGGVGHGEVGWVGVWGEGGGENQGKWGVERRFWAFAGDWRGERQARRSGFLI